MNKQMKPDRSLLQFMLRAQQQLARQNAQSSDKGYVMMLTSIITILLFSMLGAYLTMTNLNKSAVAAYADGNNTFYAAESALNKRAAIVAAKFDGYSTPAGIDRGKSAASISGCFNEGSKPAHTAATAAKPADDFECLNFPSESNGASKVVYEGSGEAADGKSSWGGTATATVKNEKNNYLSYTFVADTTDYKAGLLPVAPTAANPAGIPGTPKSKVVPASEEYAGLNVLEYKYTVYATAAKEIPGATGADKVNNTDAKTVLQMDFKSRIIPLFQFAAFYNEDMEMGSSSNMDIAGRVHTNANIYVQPYKNDPTIATTFSDKITAGGRIYNRIDSGNLIAITGSRARLKLTSPAGTYLNFPAFDSSKKSPIDLTASTIGSLTAAESTTFKSLVKDKTSGIVPLSTPNAGFLRKRNYYKSSIASNPDERQAAVGEYWAKADIRLEMVPDRDAVGTDGVTPLTATEGATAIASGTAWNRNEAIIPFNFTSIQAGAVGATSTTCTTAPPAVNADPVNTYVDATRNGASTLQCRVFTKGQLQSLRQPVMVLTKLNQASGLRAQEAMTLGVVVTPLDSFALPKYAEASAVDKKTKIVRALQVAMASTSKPIPLDSLGVRLNTYTAGSPEAEFKATFNSLIQSPSIGMLSGDLDSWTPNQIAALEEAWFLPAPIQRITSNKDTTSVAGRTNTNIRSSGFYDAREKRWITMLQTNIKSLSVWNRDGLYVDATNETLGGTNAAYVPKPASITDAFNGGAGANFSNGLAFIPASANSTEPVGSLRYLGLGSTNATEGGLVVHATVSDDLNGDNTADITTVNIDGSAISATNSIPYDRDVNGDIKYVKNPDGTDKIVGYEKNADSTYKLDGAGKQIPIKSPYTRDYLRKYWSQPEKKSPFGFAFSGGDFLPGSLNITSDQAVYLQGNFNNNGAVQTLAGATSFDPPSDNRLPAAIMADTITVLSNQCTSSGKGIDDLGLPLGQINCGIPSSLTGSKNIGVAPFKSFYNVSSSTAVNAAFLSNTDRSRGNCAPTGTPDTYSCDSSNTSYNGGGLNNYMRMLENWGGSTGHYFNYSGSFVSLGTPLEYSGGYLLGSSSRSYSQGGVTYFNYYNFPARNINFDSNFTIFSKLPPMTPSARYLQQEVFKRAYK
jgi:hypothetical protein